MYFPVIDPVATGENIRQLRQARGLSVRDLQAYFGFEEPRAIYKWQSGQTLPSVDNLYALGALFGVPMEEILIGTKPKLNIVNEQQAGSVCCSPFFQLWGLRREIVTAWVNFASLRWPCHSTSKSFRLRSPWGCC